MIVNRVENGLVAEQNSVFIAYFTKPSHIYQKNPECRAWGDSAWFAKVALLGVMVRWDGSFGFVGGKVDPGETLLEAAKRESWEEINHTPKDGDLKLVCSHSMVDGKFVQNTHLYACEVTPEELYNIRRKSGESVHGQVESAGFVAVHMVKCAPQNLKNNVWAGTALAELNILLESGVIAPAAYEDNGYEYKEPDYAGAYAEYIATMPATSTTSKAVLQIAEFMEVLNTNYPKEHRSQAGDEFFETLEKRLVDAIKLGIDAKYENSDVGCFDSLILTSPYSPSLKESYFLVDNCMTIVGEGMKTDHDMIRYMS